MSIFGQDAMHRLRYNVVNEEIRAMSMMKQRFAGLFTGLLFMLCQSAAVFAADPIDSNGTAASTFQDSAALNSASQNSVETSVQHRRLTTAFGTIFDIYEAGAVTADTGVLVVPGRWGVSPDIKRWLASIAAMGYRSLTLDLFDGRPVRDAEMADDVWQAIDPVWIEADLQAAISYLRNRQRNIVIMAWDESVRHAMQLLQQNSDVVVALVVADQPGVDEAELSVPMLEISGKGVRAGRYSNVARDAVQDFLATRF